MLAESHLTRRLFGSMVRRIDALAVLGRIGPDRWQTKMLGKIMRKRAPRGAKEIVETEALPGHLRTQSRQGLAPIRAAGVAPDNRRMKKNGSNVWRSVVQWRELGSKIEIVS